MFEADAESTDRAPRPEADAPERISPAPSPALLEPLRPTPGATIQDVAGGMLSFDWRVDAPAIAATYAGRRLRTDFCMRVTGETSGFFVMLAVAGDASRVSLPLDEIRLKLGPRYGLLARVPVRWSLILSLATGGPLFTSRESELILLARDAAPYGHRRRRA